MKLMTPKDYEQKRKKKKMPYEIFMGIAFYAVSIVQAFLFTIISKVYGIPTKNTILATCACVIELLTIATALCCFASRVYERNRIIGILLIIFALMIAFTIVVIALADLTRGWF